MGQVEVERAYRVIGMLEKFTIAIRDEAVPALERARAAWRRRVLWTDAAFAAVLAAIAIGIGVWAGFGEAFAWLGAAGFGTWIGAAVLVVAAGYVHFRVRRLAARAVARRLPARRRGGLPHRRRRARARVRARHRGVAHHVDHHSGGLGDGCTGEDCERSRGGGTLCPAAQRPVRRPLRTQPFGLGRSPRAEPGRGLPGRRRLRPGLRPGRARSRPSRRSG